MKFLKLALVTAISLGTFTQFALASGIDGDNKFYNPETSAKTKESGANGLLIASENKSSLKSSAKKPALPADVAGFVIAARGSLTATNEEGDVRTLARRSKFYANEVLKKGEGSRAQLRFKDRALMTLRPESQLNIGEYHYGGAKDPANKSFMKLVSGGFRTISGSIGKANKSAYRIETPAASIGIRGTDYELVISLDGKVFAAVHDGGITLVNDIGDLDLGADSDYLFAEVGAGQSPLGLSEMPEVFKVLEGEKTELSEEQKAKLAKKLAAGGEKIQNLLAKLGEANDDNDRGDAQRELSDFAFASDESIDTRLSPEELERLKAGDFSLSAGASGEITVGKSITNKETGEVTFLTSDNEIVRFTPNSWTEDGQLVSPGHANVVWGRWNKGVSIGAGGVADAFSFGSNGDNDQFFMAAQLMDAAQMSDLTGTLTMNGSDLSLTAGTTHESIATVVDYDGEITLDFGSNTVNGHLLVGLEDANNISLDLNIGIDGNMLDDDFSSTLTVTEGAGVPSTAITGLTTVIGGVVDSTDGTKETSGFAGSFDASLPTEITGGIDVGVKGLFVFAKQLQAKPGASFF